MYCHNCGTQLPDGAKFCTECGQRVARTDYRQLEPEPSTGILSVTRKPGSWKNEIPVEIWINGACNHMVEDGDTVTINLPSGEHTVELRLQGRNISTRLIEISDNSIESIVFVVAPPQNRSSANTRNTASNRVSSPLAARVANSGGGRTCPMCGGVMTIQMMTEPRKSGCGTILLYVLLALTVFGLLIVIPLALRKKTETVTYSVCQSCGYQKVISRR